jgi:hypothetical protein
MADQREYDAHMRELANRWVMLARDYARDSKSANATPDKAAYARGIAEGYYKAATELADVLKLLSTANAARSTGQLRAAPGPQPEPEPEPEPVSYLALGRGEVIDILMFAGLQPRDVTPNKDGTFTAVFSKWENIMPHQRLEAVKNADPRIVILESGKTKDTSDPFILLAFRG